MTPLVNEHTNKQTNKTENTENIWRNALPLIKSYLHRPSNFQQSLEYQHQTSWNNPTQRIPLTDLWRMHLADKMAGHRPKTVMQIIVDHVQKKGDKTLFTWNGF